MKAVNVERRAGIFIGPEFGTVRRSDIVAAAREAAGYGYDVLICCAFCYSADCADLPDDLPLPVIRATSAANLFVAFGEPDISVEDAGGDLIQVRMNGVDVFDPRSCEVRSDDPDGIACWFVDTDYRPGPFVTRQAYFPGASVDPYQALKKTLKADVDPETWASLRRTVSRPFPRPASGRIAVKAINALGDEAMKVVRVGGTGQ